MKRQVPAARSLSIACCRSPWWHEAPAQTDVSMRNAIWEPRDVRLLLSNSQQIPGHFPGNQQTKDYPKTQEQAPIPKPLGPQETMRNWLCGDNPITGPLSMVPRPWVGIHAGALPQPSLILKLQVRSRGSSPQVGSLGQRVPAPNILVFRYRQNTCNITPRGSKYTIFKVSGPKNHSCYGFKGSGTPVEIIISAPY